MRYLAYVNVSTWLTATGLLLDIVGVLGLWRFGLPPEIRRGGTSFLMLEGTDVEEARKAERYDRYARVAITLIVLGFALQLLAVMISALTP